MRTTLNLDEDALLMAKQVAAREQLSRGEAVSRLIRQGCRVGVAATVSEAPLRGRFAILPERDEVITSEHVRDLLDREGIRRDGCCST